MFRPAREEEWMNKYSMDESGDRDPLLGGGQAGDFVV